MASFGNFWNGAVVLFKVLVIFVKAWCCAFATFLSRETLAVSLAECRKTAIIKENKIYLMEIIYMPGFGGNENSETFKTIFSKYPNSIFINYDNRNAENAHNQILKELNKINSEDKIIVGQSLGGFWADYFA